MAIVLSLSLAVSIVLQGPGNDPVPWLWIATVLAVIAAVVLTPLAYRWALFGVHDAAQLRTVGWVLLPPALVFLLLLLLEFLGSHVATTTADDVVPATAVVLTVALIGGVLGTHAITIYMVVSQAANVHLNELFAGIRSEGHKQFLRVTVSADKVQLHAIGYRRVVPRTVHWKNGRPRLSKPRWSGFPHCGTGRLVHTSTGSGFASIRRSAAYNQETICCRAADHRRLICVVVATGQSVEGRLWS